MANDEKKDKVSIDQYGRRKWNVDAYAEDAKRKAPKVMPSATNDQAEVDYNTPQSYLKHRENALKSLIDVVGQHAVINPLNTKSFGKNKKYGFVCEICDLSFRDNLALIDHINSPQHIQKIQSTDASGTSQDSYLESGIRHATVDEVRRTLRTLIKQKQLKNKGIDKVNIQERISKRLENEKKRAEKRRVRKHKSRLKSDSFSAENLLDDAAEDDNSISRIMGIKSFASTHK